MKTSPFFKILSMPTNGLVQVQAVSAAKPDVRRALVQQAGIAYCYPLLALNDFVARLKALSQLGYSSEATKDVTDRLDLLVGEFNKLAEGFAKDGDLASARTRLLALHKSLGSVSSRMPEAFGPMLEMLPVVGGLAESKYSNAQQINLAEFFQQRVFPLCEALSNHNPENFDLGKFRQLTLGVAETIKILDPAVQTVQAKGVGDQVSLMRQLGTVVSVLGKIGEAYQRAELLPLKAESKAYAASTKRHVDEAILFFAQVNIWVTLPVVQAQPLQFGQRAKELLKKGQQLVKNLGPALEEIFVVLKLNGGVLAPKQAGQSKLDEFLGKMQHLMEDVCALKGEPQDGSAQQSRTQEYCGRLGNIFSGLERALPEKLEPAYVWVSPVQHAMAELQEAAGKSDEDFQKAVTTFRSESKGRSGKKTIAVAEAKCLERLGRDVPGLCDDAYTDFPALRVAVVGYKPSLLVSVVASGRPSLAELPACLDLSKTVKSEMQQQLDHIRDKMGVDQKEFAVLTKAAEQIYKFSQASRWLGSIDPATRDLRELSQILRSSSSVDELPYPAPFDAGTYGILVLLARATNFDFSKTKDLLDNNVEYGKAAMDSFRQRFLDRKDAMKWGESWAFWGVDTFYPALDYVPMWPYVSGTVDSLVDGVYPEFPEIHAHSEADSARRQEEIRTALQFLAVPTTLYAFQDFFWNPGLWIANAAICFQNKSGEAGGSEGLAMFTRLGSYFGENGKRLGSKVDGAIPSISEKSFRLAAQVFGRIRDMSDEDIEAWAKRGRELGVASRDFAVTVGLISGASAALGVPLSAAAAYAFFGMAGSRLAESFRGGAEHELTSLADRPAVQNACKALDRAVSALPSAERLAGLVAPPSNPVAYGITSLLDGAFVWSLETGYAFDQVLAGSMAVRMVLPAAIILAKRLRNVPLPLAKLGLSFWVFDKGWEKGCDLADRITISAPPRSEALAACETAYDLHTEGDKYEYGPLKNSTSSSEVVRASGDSELCLQIVKPYYKEELLAKHTGRSASASDQQLDANIKLFECAAYCDKFFATGIRRNKK